MALAEGIHTAVGMGAGVDSGPKVRDNAASCLSEPNRPDTAQKPSAALLVSCELPTRLLAATGAAFFYNLTKGGENGGPVTAIYKLSLCLRGDHCEDIFIFLFLFEYHGLRNGEVWFGYGTQYSVRLFIAMLCSVAQLTLNSALQMWKTKIKVKRLNFFPTM